MQPEVRTVLTKCRGHYCGAPHRSPISLACLILIAFTCAASRPIGSHSHRPPVPHHKYGHSLPDHDGRQRTPFSAQDLPPLRTYRACRQVDGTQCDICFNGICAETVDTTALLPIWPAGILWNNRTNANVTGVTLRSVLEVWISVRFILVRKDAVTGRSVAPYNMAQQLLTLNEAFVNTPFRFFFDSYEEFVDPRMADSCNTDPCYVNPATCEFYTYTLPKVTKAVPYVANVVIYEALPYDGESQFPWADDETSPLQYIEIRLGAFYGYGNNTQRNLGHTLIHEMGHFLGLLHVFERNGACNFEGDYVNDTTASKYPTGIQAMCSAIDTNNLCSTQHFHNPDDDYAYGGTGVLRPESGNFMDYSADACVNHFTLGQRRRMIMAVNKYRPQLLRHRAAWSWCEPTSAATNASSSNSTLRLNYAQHVDMTLADLSVGSALILKCGCTAPENSEATATVNVDSAGMCRTIMHTGGQRSNASSVFPLGNRGYGYVVSIFGVLLFVFIGWSVNPAKSRWELVPLHEEVAEKPHEVL